MTALLDAIARTRRTSERGVTLSPKVWRDLRTQLDELHAFVQQVAEESCQERLVNRARELGADT